jgi:hydrogenase expression/formation protein HypE
MTCPLSEKNSELITLEHGSGGKKTSELLEKIFLPAFNNSFLNMLHDGAALILPHNRIAFTTDSYVVQPLFFPGGDIGKLAITGTLNDLAMCGAKPLYLSCSFIMEEGFSQNDLRRIVASMKHQTEAHCVPIVTGDTKVIERQNGQNLLITTSGIGIQMASVAIHPLQIVAGDLILLSNDIGRHSVAVMAEREKLSFAQPLLSDCASVAPIIEKLLAEKIEIHCLRDPTRGGLATALVEIGAKAKLEFLISEETIPIDPFVANVCDILGLDALYLANEGCFIAFVPEIYGAKAIDIIRQFPVGKQATVIGQVIGSSQSGRVKIKNRYGSERYLHALSGAQLPRIC